MPSEGVAEYFLHQFTEVLFLSWLSVVLDFGGIASSGDFRFVDSNENRFGCFSGY